MVHPKVVTEFMSHDGCERGNVVIGELRRDGQILSSHRCVCVLVTHTYTQRHTFNKVCLLENETNPDKFVLLI